MNSDWKRRTALRVSTALGVAVALDAVRSARERGRALPLPRKVIALAPGSAAPRQGSAGLMQLCAHPDDDLYFMNPDLQLAIRAGADVTSVYLAAGEADGRNADTRDPQRRKTPVDFPGYAEARQNGLRAAYADMATGDRRSPWRREVVQVTPNVMVERDILLAAPRVRIYFFSTRIAAQREAGILHGPTSAQRLRLLWNGVESTLSTLVTRDSPLSRSQQWTRQDLIDALAVLLKQHQPTVVHTMDPDPEHASYSATRGVTSSDHQDHTATAEFALAALAVHRAETGAAPLVVPFRAYANTSWPANLSEQEYAQKLALLSVYGGAVPDCTDGMCGDRQVFDGAASRGYGQSIWPRYELGADWLRRDRDGRLWAFVVRNGGVSIRTQSQRDSADWSGPVDVPTNLPGAVIMPSLAVAEDGEGRFHLVALARTASASRGHVRVQVVLCSQEEPGGAFGPWTSLGNPQGHTQTQALTREVGTPVAAFDSSGMLHVFVRNFAHGVSFANRPPGGSWGGWHDLKGRDVQDALTAFTRADGGVELIAPTRTGILRWSQAAPGQPLGPTVRLDVPPPASPVTMTESAAQEFTLLYREAGTAQVMSLALPRSGSAEFTLKPVGEGGHGGTGPIAAVTTDDGTFLAHRNLHGNVAWRSAGGDSGAPWTDTDQFLVHAPVAALDAGGRICVAVVGLDGGIHLSQQSGSRPVPGLTPWRAL
jgi:LmbE family N-acetylglucosaminyl deacetylase